MFSNVRYRTLNSFVDKLCMQLGQSRFLQKSGIFMLHQGTEINSILLLIHLTRKQLINNINSLVNSTLRNAAEGEFPAQAPSLQPEPKARNATAPRTIFSSSEKKLPSACPAVWKVAPSASVPKSQLCEKYFLQGNQFFFYYACLLLLNSAVNILSLLNSAVNIVSFFFKDVTAIKCNYGGIAHILICKSSMENQLLR